ncbi:hypothetical protein [Polyangium jinanense]|uniref:Uncharacterized protein n=1 Tax=Polyangium jinanense TaxID=2829994 RepID=A0A9X3XFD6_9BACT|nr:hypothetical protein [Polyangium jinanense]MDC3962664.1 hypothetical protein [Polyangium jinanense]MDC3989384.1 hypothetical protein [Polyangium jinanense]
MSDPLSASTKVRIGGAVLLGAGLVCLKIAVIDVLAAARAFNGTVTTYIKATVIAPLFIALGLLCLVIGAPREPKPGSLVLYFVTGHGRDSRLKPLGYVGVFIMIGIGLGLHAWVNGELRSLGYE